MKEQQEPAVWLGDESKPIKFPGGLIGLEEWQDFAVVSHPAGGSLQLLQSLEDDRMSFIVANPYQIDADYKVKLSQADVNALRHTGKPGVLNPDADPLAVICIVSVQEDPFEVTANLLGPLVINSETGLGLQVILADSSYSTHHLVADKATEPPVAAVEHTEEV
jgi:flagellar assembly factor FliW